VPLFIGSGMRGKILEGFAAAKAIVSTRLGAEGIEVEDGRNILLADDPATFASAIRRLSDDEALARRIGAEARRTAEGRYSWRAVAEELVATYRARLKP
jgi:glycosyltransferase involved in cell wall biosynthesis